MASTTRAAAKAVPHLLKGTRSMDPNRKARANLIYNMQTKLFPEQGVEAINKSLLEQMERVKEYETSAKKRAKAEKWVERLNKKEFAEQEKPQFMGRSEASKELWKMQYSDAKFEKTLKHRTKLEIYPQKTPIKKTCPDPVSLIQSTQISALDPTGARTRLFAKTNPECARVGDILLVRQRTGEPFAGVCINIRRRGVDTAILLRGQLTRVGVEMWFKVYSPLVEGIEVVQRAQKRARRARLTFMRKTKHDRGSVENVVRVYMRQKAALGTADGKKKGAAMSAAGGNKKTKGRGKKR